MASSTQPTRRSKARHNFEENVKDVDRLLEIHKDLGGPDRGRRFELEVLNKSAVVLICACWEAYVEDICEEATDFVIDNVPAAEDLPRGLQESIATKLFNERNPLAVWTKIGTGWQSLAKQRVRELTEALHHPNMAKVKSLFNTTLGIRDISKEWHWQRVSPKLARKKLKEFIKMRGDIAHRVQLEDTVKKSTCTAFLKYVNGIIKATDRAVNTQVETLAGRPLF